MTEEKLKQLEQKTNELFGEKAVMSVAEIKAGNKGYVVRIKVQGMPFEISATQKTLLEAEELAYEEFERNAKEALEKSLFPTQPIERYKMVPLSDEQFKKLFGYEEWLSEEYMNELKEKTTAKVCQLSDGSYECVLDSPYMCLHARGRASTIDLSILSASIVARDVFGPMPIYVGQKPWTK